MVNRNVGILDEHYHEHKDELSDFTKNNFENMNDALETDNKFFKEKLDDLEIGILNGSEKYKGQIKKNLDIKHKLTEE